MISRKKTFNFSSLLVVILCSVGCTTSQIYQSSTSMAVPLSSSILIFPIDVQVVEDQVLSSAEALADESKGLATKLMVSFEDYLFDKGVEVVSYGHDSIQDQHMSIINQAAIMREAATSSSSRNYVLDSGSLSLLSKYDATYVLFSDYKEVTDSDARKAVDLILTLATGTYTSNAGKKGYSLSLFDLRDGQLAWSYTQPFGGAGGGEVGSGTLSVGDNERLIKSTTEKMFSNFPL